MLVLSIIVTSHLCEYFQPKAKISSLNKTQIFLHLTAEMAPVAKVGGLGDVVQGLAKASLEKGHNVQVCDPLAPSTVFPWVSCNS